MKKQIIAEIILAGLMLAMGYFGFELGKQINGCRQEASQKANLPSYDIVENVITTAYSSDHNQTDSTPYITSTQERCFYGGCAVSREMEKIAPMGSKIILDNKEFYVNDRMSHKWTGYMIDLWMETRADAKRYGKQRKGIVIIIQK